MKVKKIVAKNMPEAMVKIREELGNDAVILNSKKIDTGGFLGFFTKKNIEVIAAIDPVKRKAPQRSNVRVTQKKKLETEKKNQLQGEIAELKQLIQNMGKQQVQPMLTTEAFPGYLQEVNQTFQKEEINDVYRLQLMKSLLKRWYSENGEEKKDEEIIQWKNETLSEFLGEVEYGPFTFNKRYLNLVGPTGVGKTTTLAKIAAKAMLVNNKKIAFITTDTYRIAAIDQLKTYAKILNVPVEVAYSIQEFKQAKERFKDVDLVLVDSAGRNFKNSLYVEQLKEVIGFDDEMETHLVLSLTSKYSDMKNIIDQFQQINIAKVIYTKADETDSYGSIVNIHGDYKIGPSYITTGQNVPDDILEASKEKVLELILRR